MTELERRVLEHLRTIPRGKVTTYGQLAEQLGNKRFCRAVGNALHRNPDGNYYPCYKVVDSRGRLSANYAFGGAEGQKMRLEAEGIEVKDNKVDLRKYLHKGT